MLLYTQARNVTMLQNVIRCNKIVETTEFVVNLYLQIDVCWPDMCTSDSSLQL